MLLGYPSSVVKDSANKGPVQDLITVLEATRPEVVYTHNLADKHATHVAVALRVIEAIRSLPADARPARLYGCEVWRDLNWLLDSDKVIFDTSAMENLGKRCSAFSDSHFRALRSGDDGPPRQRHLLRVAWRGQCDRWCSAHLTPLITDPS